MGEPLRVVVADDEEDMRVLLTGQLSLVGRCDVVGEAVDGEHAVQLFRALDPDVVVLDQRMPNLTGIEAAAVMRDERPDVRLVLYTAYADPSIRSEAERLDVRCIAKGHVPGLIGAVTGD